MRRWLGIGAILAFAAAGAAACEPRPPVAIFPSDALTVADPNQATGRRINLVPPENCVTFKSKCDEVALLNELDGFDLDPTVSLTFDGPIDVTKVNDTSAFIQRIGGGPSIGLNRLVWDAATNTLLGHPKRQLAEATRYLLRVTAAVNGQTGTATFTTMSATKQLRQIRSQLDDGSAYAAAGITDRRLRFDTDSRGDRAVYAGAVINGSLAPGSAGTRTNDGSHDTPTEEAFSSLLPGLAEFVGFGRVEMPSWLNGDRRIPHTPTGAGAPAVQGKETVGFVVVTPQPSLNCPKPANGWPVAIFGPGFTRSKYDLLLASDEVLRRCRATIAIDPVGHAYGLGSYITLNLLGVPPSQVAVTAHGRGRDRDGDGDIEPDEGVGTLGQPNRYASIALRDGLRQTVADNMALLRAIQLDVDVDGLGSSDLSATDIKYYGQSFGGIYGTMFVATDTKLGVGVLNVPGGPILDIARLSPAFRDRVGTELMNRQPSAFNGTAGDPTSFDESQPLYLDPPETSPAAGAVGIQQIGGRTNWMNRSGSPEAFAPLLMTLANPDDVLYQFAYGDQTVSNPTNATLMRAGHLQGVTTLYRNDRTPTATCDPHGFLLDPRITGRQQGQIQAATFLAGGGIVDPDGAATVFEVPVANPSSIETLNFSALACPFEVIGVP